MSHQQRFVTTYNDKELQRELDLAREAGDADRAADLEALQRNRAGMRARAARVSDRFALDDAGE
jgi:hypothetical protein